MTLQNNKNNSWTKSTLQSVNIPRPRTSEPNVNIKHAYYYNASVTMTMTHGGDIMPANTRFSCIVMCRVYSCTTPFSTPLFLVCFLLVNEAGIYYQLTLQYGCYFIVFCFCHQLPWWLWHGTSWILVWPAVIAMLLNCRWNHDFQSWHYQKCHWPATLWRCLYKMFCTKLNGISLNTCQDWLLHSTCCVFLLGWNVLLNEHCLHRHCLKKCMDITLSETLLNLTTLDILFISKRCLSITASNGRLSNGNGYLF